MIAAISASCKSAFLKKCKSKEIMAAMYFVIFSMFIWTHILLKWHKVFISISNFIFTHVEISSLVLTTLPAAAAKSHQLCPTLCDPLDHSPPGSSVPGILQPRILEWVAISFSSAWKWKVKVKSLSHIWLLATPWTVGRLLSPWDIPGKRTGVECHCLLQLCLKCNFKLLCWIPEQPRKMQWNIYSTQRNFVF